MPPSFAAKVFSSLWCHHVQQLLLSEAVHFPKGFTSALFQHLSDTVPAVDCRGRRVGWSWHVSRYAHFEDANAMVEAGHKPCATLNAVERLI